MRQLCFGENQWGCRKLISHIEALPPKESATVRKAMGGSGWDNDTELSAVTVELLQLILRTLQVAHLQDPPTDPLIPVPRPYKVETPPEESVGLAGLNDFLEGPF